MNYRVIWIRKALDELTALWTAASNRAAVTAASHRTDQQLARDPLNYGESRGGADRIAFEAPLAVPFRTDEAAQVVRVIAVGPAGRPA